MRKTIFVLLCGLMQMVSASAQTPFEKGKFYASTGLTGLNLTYDKASDWNLGLMAKGGYLFEDNWMLTAQAEYDYHKVGDNYFKAGAGVRYYIEQNGLYLGLGANYVHAFSNYDDFMPTAQLGYCFFLNRTVTIEPEVCYNQSLKNHSCYSGFGLRINFGIYFE